MVQRHPDELENVSNGEEMAHLNKNANISQPLAKLICHLILTKDLLKLTNDIVMQS